MDIARYADSTGFEQDYTRPNAWRYRDYVISAFNKDKPYNQFLREQIAGDELDLTTDETRIATGFLRAGPRVQFREKDNPERRHDYLNDVLATIGRGVLGITIHCARCHDHKFDPILQKDYYSLQSSIFGYVEIDYPLLDRAEADAYRTQNAEIDALQHPLKDQIAAIEEPHRERLQVELIKERFPENVQRVRLLQGRRQPLLLHRGRESAACHFRWWSKLHRAPVGPRAHPRRLRRCLQDRRVGGGAHYPRCGLLRSAP